MTPELKAWLDANDLGVATVCKNRGIYEVRLWSYQAQSRGPHGDGRHTDSDCAERAAVLDWQRKEEESDG
jgi:hypothetical protein